MKIDQLMYHSNQFFGEATLGDNAQWVLVFGEGRLLCDHRIFEHIRDLYPHAYIMGCSTAGEIHENAANEHSLSITAVMLDKTQIKFSSYPLHNSESSESYETGRRIISELEQDGLKHVFVLCEGLHLNGSRLVEGMRERIKGNVPITGGLAGDGTDFGTTYVMCNEVAKPDQIVVAAFYGKLRTGCASVGGWDTFGIERVVTKSKDNVLYEMDGKPALDLYKEYLGEKAKELPSSALLFPLNVRLNGSEKGIVRTILSVDEDEKSLIFAGDIPVNSFCKLMKSNNNNLVIGSATAAEFGRDMLDAEKIELAILISCVGRKLVLKQRTDEEIEAVREVVGNNTIITGFYSYGEIAPHKKDTECELHNQTMTVTFFSEE